MFPELISRFKSAFSGFGSAPIALDLKTAGGVNFDAINVGWYARNGYPQIYSILSGGMPAWSGEPVSIETALNHSVVYACYRILANGVGQTPCLMYRETGDPLRPIKNPARQHPMYGALKNAPNDEISALAFTEMLTGHCAMQGNGYAHIIRRSGTGTAIELRALSPSQVFPDRERDGQKRLIYVVKEPGVADKTYTVQRGKPQDILHIRGLGWDGLRGFSIVTMGRQSMGTAIGAERNVARFYANGGRLPYVLKLNKSFKNDQDFDKFRTDWERIYSEPHRAPMLEPFIEEYKQIGLSATDAQLLETRQFGVAEICRWFGISPHLAGDLSKAPYAAIEQLALEFVKFTLGAWLKRWEDDLWRCVLTPQEKEDGYFFYHDVDALLRGDFESRMKGYSTMLQNGIASVNEVRYREGLNAIDGGDDHHIQLNMQTLPGGEPTSAQTGALVKLGAK